MKVAVIIMNRDRPDLADSVYEQVQQMGKSHEVTTTVIEAGSKKKDGCSKYMTHWFKDKPYRGRYHAFHRGLQHVLKQHPSKFDYFWFLCNDIVFPDNQDTLSELIECMSEDPLMAVIGPSESNQEWYPGAKSNPKKRWHKSATVHGLAQLIRGKVIDEIGYMNPDFHYSQGAGTEYAYKLYSKNWFMAYANQCSVHHVEGSTYGTVVPISRHEYQRKANLFANQYLTKEYGQEWDRLFASVLPDDCDKSTYSWQRSIWSQILPEEPLPPLYRVIGSKIKKRLQKYIPPPLSNN